MNVFEKVEAVMQENVLLKEENDILRDRVAQLDELENLFAGVEFEENVLEAVEGEPTPEEVVAEEPVVE